MSPGRPRRRWENNNRSLNAGRWDAD
jgi:hypothetical protein